MSLSRFKVDEFATDTKLVNVCEGERERDKSA